MDLSPTTEQQQIIDALRVLLERNAGQARVQEMVRAQAYDHELDAVLDEAGFLDMAAAGLGPVEAGLATIEVGKAVGTVAYAAGALVAPRLLGANPKVPVAITRMPADFPVRLAQHAKLVLIDDGDEARLLEVADGDVVAQPNGGVGWPMGKLTQEALGKARGLGPGTGETLRRWWRLALAFETIGVMQGALDLTLLYLKTRRQFGRAIGEFQTLQHRISELVITLEGARWVALEAAFRDAAPINAATAAGRAAGLANLVARECHQMHGAIGLTREYPLHLWTTRLGPLAVEMGGAAAHRREAARLRFSAEEIERREAYWL